MALRRVTLINLALFGIGAILLLSQTSVQDYLLSRSPRERLMNHFKEFEKKMARDPEIRRALHEPGLANRSERLQEWSRLGAARLDDTTLVDRARIMSAIYSRMSDRACAKFVRGTPLTENDTVEFERALLALEVEGVSKWMVCLHKAILAEVRHTPKRMITQQELFDALRVLAQKIGRDPVLRMDKALGGGASDAELSWATRTVYAEAPTLPQPHGVVLLRALEETPSDSLSKAEVR